MMLKSTASAVLIHATFPKGIVEKIVEGGIFQLVISVTLQNRFPSKQGENSR